MGVEGRGGGRPLVLGSIPDNEQVYICASIYLIIIIVR